MTSVASRSLFLLFGATALVGGASAIAQAPPGAVEAPPPPENPQILSAEEALVIDGRAYAERYGVSLEEGMRRMAIMAEGQNEINEVARQNAGDLAGVYFTHGQDFGVVVRLVEGRSRPNQTLSVAPRGANRRAAAAEPGNLARRLGVTSDNVEAARSVMSQDLRLPVRFQGNGRVNRRSVRDAISRHYERFEAAYPSLQGIGYDEARGVVVLQILASDRGVAVPQPLAALLPVPVETEVLPAPLTPAAARGGTTIYWGGTTSLNCTAGFIGINPAGARGIVTAGHCVDPTWTGGYDYIDAGRRYRLVGGFLRRDDSGADIMFWGLPSGLTAVPEFYGNRNEAARVLTGRRTISSTNATVTDNVSQGSVVCFYGMRTGPTFGQSCGEVTYKGYALGGGTGYYVQIEGTMTCNSGDSGAPVFAWNTAFGIVRGCSPLATTAGGTRYMTYTSTDALYAHGYSLAY